MLSYLDNAQNRVGKINENFSRELMELFTIGRGQYRYIYSRRLKSSNWMEDKA